MTSIVSGLNLGEMFTKFNDFGDMIMVDDSVDEYINYTEQNEILKNENETYKKIIDKDTEKYRKRRDSNNLSARLSRKRRKDQHDMLKNLYDEKCLETRSLKREIEELKNKNKELEKLIKK